MNRTKKLISDTFWQLLEEKPYSKITVHDIVERCQVNRNTFYYHFQDIPTLVEHTIKEWSDELIKNHYEFGAPENCLDYMAKECTARKTALLHLYRSAHRESFMNCLNKIGFHIIRAYVDNAVKSVDIPQENQKILIRFYKCALIGIILDWLDEGTSYDLLDFCDKVCDSFNGAGKNAFLKYAKDKE